MTAVPTDMTHWDGCQKVHPSCACPLVWELPGRWAAHPHHCSSRIGHDGDHRCICGQVLERHSDGGGAPEQVQ